MRLVLSTYSLDYAGVPTYTLTLYQELLKRGEDVWVYCPVSGPLAQLMRVVEKPGDLPWIPDAIIAQHNRCAVSLRAKFPETPMVYSAHGVLPEIEQPPRGIRVDWWTAINRQVRDHLVRQHLPPARIDIVRDFVDLDTYQPRKPLKIITPRVLFISNYKRWKAHWRLKRACDRLRLPFKAVGSPYGRSKDMAAEINDADLVVSWGRGILEGMACGRAVISYDKELGDGFLDSARYLESREHNFCGYECRYHFTVDQLMDELCKYTRPAGEVNRHIAVTEHDVVHGTNLLLDAVESARRR